jgi:sigma-B regulation protein RsbU (phosphoserine phosphatase)
LFYGVFDGAVRTLRYVNAGHNPPVVVRVGGSIDWLEAGGPPVGMFPDSTYEEKAVRLEPGDFVIAYTDGVTEATNPGGEAWGVQGLLRAAAGWAPKNSDDAEDLVRLIFNSMDDFSRRCQSDDVTLAVLCAR